MNSYKKLIVLICIILSVSISMQAQDVAVKSFELDETDVTANLQGTTVLDQNGEKCALIKIFTTATGFTFDVGSMGVQKVEQRTGEIWVYVPYGVKRMTLNHSQLGLCEYSFPVAIERARTYRMKLVAGEVHTIVKKAITSQYVMFKMNSQKGSIEINNQLIDIVDGGASVRLPFGSYRYRVQASGYFPEEGTVLVNNPKERHVVTVNLEPAFTNVTIKVDADAEIWVNDVKKGMRTFTGSIPYGTYLMECRQAGHVTSQKEITLTKENAGQTIVLPAPTPIYGSLDINSTPVDADIYIDGKRVGSTPMFIPELIIGQHSIKVSKSQYGDYTENITIKEGETSAVNTSLQKRTVQTSKNKDGKVYDVVEQMPSFPGGMSALMQYLSSHIIYPSEAEKNGIQGRVICNFIVEEDGSITSVHVSRSIDPSLDKEAVRVINNMPIWNPGKQNGSACRVRFTLPINFKLAEDVSYNDTDVNSEGGRSKENKCSECAGTRICSGKNHCQGTGKCAYCQGRGLVGSGRVVCSLCKGTGYCKYCKGTGKCTKCG